MNKEVEIIKEEVTSHLKKGKNEKNAKNALEACKKGLIKCQSADDYSSKHFDSSFFLSILADLVPDIQSTVKFYDQALSASEMDMKTQPDAQWNMTSKMRYSELAFLSGMLIARSTNNANLLNSAVNRLREAIKYTEAVEKNMTPRSLRLYYAEALLWHRLTSPDKAVDRLEKGLDFILNGPNFSEELCQTALNLLVHLLCEMMQLDKAAKIANKAMERSLRENLLGKKMAGAESAKRSALVKQRQERFVEADKMLKMTTKAVVDQHGPDHPMLGSVHMQRCDVLARKDDQEKSAGTRDEQIKLLQEARRVFMKNEGPKSEAAKECERVLTRVEKGESVLDATKADPVSSSEAARGESSNGGSPKSPSGESSISVTEVKAKVKSATTMQDATVLLGLAEALFREDKNYSLAEQVLAKAATIFKNEPQTEDVKKRLEVSEYNLKIMRRNRIIELWEEVVDEELAEATEKMSMKDDGDGASTSNRSDEIDENLTW